MSLMLIAMVVVASAVYWLPTLIAVRRHHPNAVPIFVINLFFGTIGLGWIGSLVWSLLSVNHPKPVPGFLRALVVAGWIVSILFGVWLATNLSAPDAPSPATPLSGGSKI